MNDNVMGLPGSRPENLSHIIQVRAGDNYLPFVNCQWRMETEESLKEELKESRKSVSSSLDANKNMKKVDGE